MLEIEVDERTADLLDAAADVLDRHGWRQNDVWSDEWWCSGKSVCAVGALYVAQAGQSMIRPPTIITDRVRGALLLLARLIEDAPVPFGKVSVIVTDWNDHHNRTAAEVTDLLRRAAKIARTGRADL